MVELAAGRIVRELEIELRMERRSRRGAQVIENRMQKRRGYFRDQLIAAPLKPP
jgi:hypothetical protein